MKKFLLFFGLLCAINLMFAQETVIRRNGRDFHVSMDRANGNQTRWGESNPTVPQDSIRFWTGKGSNRAVIAITWDDEVAGAIGIAWGVQWNGASIQLKSLMDTIAVYDNRLTVTNPNGSNIDNFVYNDSELGFNLVGEYGWWWYNWKNSSDELYESGGITYDMVQDGDFVDWMQYSSADLMIYATDPNGGDTPPIPPTPPTPTFTADDIHYWVGTGDASAIVAVSWDEDEVALAWGVHFDEDYYPSTIDLLDSIKSYDPRFDYHVSYHMSTPYNISSISFTEGNLTLSQTNTSNIMVQVLTSEGETDAISGDELEDYSIWDGDFVQISTAGLFDFSDLEAVEPPAAPIEPEVFCTTIHPLTYSEDFSSYTSDQSMHPYFASAPIPECWTVLGNGTVHHVGTGSSTDADYFGGVGYSTSTNSFGAVTANDAFFNFIASQIYTGSNTNYINDMLTTGTRRYAILPPFDQPLSQTILTFDHRTNMADANTHLSVGYIVNDTADFVALEIYTADNKVLHHDTIRFSQYAGIPDNARLTMMWDVASTTASATGPGNRYCGIDNLIVALDVTDTTPVTEDPVDATIALSDILYWVGSGSNSAALIVSYAEPEVALAWGVHFDGSISATDMLDSVQAADPRFWYVGNPSNGGDIHFVTDDGDTLGLSPTLPTDFYDNYFWTNLNGFSTWGTNITDGDVLKYGDAHSGIGYDMHDGYYYEYAWTTVPTPVSVPDTGSTPVVPVPEEATIAFSDILFWVGEGTNEAVLAVNWADTALAWGYRWNGEATVATMMDHIAAADPRFSYTGVSFMNDINYIDTAAGMTTPLGITPGNIWESKNNGNMDSGLGQVLSNGDIEKWADPAAGIVVDSISYLVDTVTMWFNIYVYPMTIYPVTVPDTTGSGPGPDPQPEHGPFCGPVGTEGCNAIAYDDNAFVAWATNVVVTRGPQNIANPDGPLASFGSDSNAIGPASMDNMDAVSLGDGGSALVTFERPIRNGEGPDFAVFENDNNGGFLELAFVEVSSDGMHFVRFPATSLTQTETQIGTFGLSDPTFINNLAGKFQIGYGTPFDLEELRDSANINIDSIVYVRIVDVVGSINPLYATYDAFGHMVNDPWPTNFWTSGFDLTGVGVIHSLNVGIDEHQISRIYAYPNPCTGTLHIVNDNAEKVELYNMNGKLLEMVNDGETRITLNMEHYPAGLYLLKVGNGVQKILKK